MVLYEWKGGWVNIRPSHYITPACRIHIMQHPDACYLRNITGCDIQWGLLCLCIPYQKYADSDKAWIFGWSSVFKVIIIEKLCTEDFTFAKHNYSNKSTCLRYITGRNIQWGSTVTSYIQMWRRLSHWINFDWYFVFNPTIENHVFRISHTRSTIIRITVYTRGVSYCKWHNRKYHWTTGLFWGKSMIREVGGWRRSAQISTLFPILQAHSG